VAVDGAHLRVTLAADTRPELDRVGSNRRVRRRQRPGGRTGAGRGTRGRPATTRSLQPAATVTTLRRHLGPRASTFLAHSKRPVDRMDHSSTLTRRPKEVNCSSRRVARRICVVVLSFLRERRTSGQLAPGSQLRRGPCTSGSCAPTRDPGSPRADVPAVDARLCTNWATGGARKSENTKRSCRRQTVGDARNERTVEGVLGCCRGLASAAGRRRVAAVRRWHPVRVSAAKSSSARWLARHA